jgi:glucose/arabinose dehydrogenase
VPKKNESDFTGSFVAPLVTFFTVPAGYELAKSGTATIAPSGLDLYTSKAIPGWADSLIVTGMRTGAIYRAKLSRDGRHVEGAPLEYFKAATRYRDLAINPDGLRIYISTDDHGATMGDRGQTAGVLANSGAILEFIYSAK